MAYVNRTTIKWCSINYNADFLKQVNCTLKYSAKKSVIIWLSRFARSAVTIKRFLKYRLNFFMNAIKRLKNARKLPGFRIFEGKNQFFYIDFFVWLEFILFMSQIIYQITFLLCTYIIHKKMNNIIQEIHYRSDMHFNMHF